MRTRSIVRKTPFVTAQALPHLFLILRTHLWRSHTDAEVGGVVVRPHKVLKDVDVSPRLVFRQVSPHAHLHRSIKYFDDARLRLLGVSGEVMDAVLLQHSLNETIKEFKSTRSAGHCCQRDRPATADSDLPRQRIVP